MLYFFMGVIVALFIGPLIFGILMALIYILSWIKSLAGHQSAYQRRLQRGDIFATSTDAPIEIIPSRGRTSEWRS